MLSFAFDKFRAEEVHPIVLSNIAREAGLMTDEVKKFEKIGREFAECSTTLHGSRQYLDYSSRTIQPAWSSLSFAIIPVRRTASMTVAVRGKR